MKTVKWIICLMGLSLTVNSQTIPNKIAKLVEEFQMDPQMKHAILGVSIVNTNTGEKIYDINGQVGLVPASCQKIFTSITAFELLGSEYTYRTVLGYDGKIANGILQGNLYVQGNGDPSLGSWRFESTKEEKLLKNWIEEIKSAGIRKMNGSIIGFSHKWEKDFIPGGWIWDDIGNYYGAGITALNWHENQYDVILSSGDSIGEKVSIVNMQPIPYKVSMESQLTAAVKGSGDNAYIYLPPFSKNGFIRGTIPVNEKAFTISGSFPNPTLQTLSIIFDRLMIEKIQPDSMYCIEKEVPHMQLLLTHVSPPLDSLNYWFMKKSINLYGEAFLKTMAFEKVGIGSTEKGIGLLKKFWKEHGIESSSIQIIDGSGLSPQNRVTTDALVAVLQHAKGKRWYSSFYESLPVFNQMKLKSGTIGGAKSFAGYHTAKDGTKYTMAIIVNNYDGSAGEIVKKMFTILDVLK